MKALFFAVWACLIGFCYWALIAYSADSGAQNHQADLKTWPVDTTLARNKGRFTLVTFMHPHCPCSRASLNELNKIMTRTHNNMDCQIVFLKPSSCDSEWEKSDLWKMSTLVPNSQRKSDVDGVIAKSFNATTSGQTFLYNPDGKLVFAGGVTASRGHEGDSLGSIAIEDLAAMKRAKANCSQVFGCPLFEKKI
ncbi:MAG: RedB protein [Cyanobacteria bacterium TGS_CYA1]|nr:RedB protein [Cyanobacteria bacterium TGS_CYA1]